MTAGVPPAAVLATAAAAALVLGALVFGWAALRGLLGRRQALGVGAALVGVATAAMAVAWSAAVDTLVADPAGGAGRWAGSSSCGACHADHVGTWGATYHRTMTQEPSSASVRGDFSGVRLDLMGVPSRLFQQDGAFFMEVLDPGWEATVLRQGIQPARVFPPVLATFRVDRVVGSHLMQVYLTRLPGGEYRVLPLVWDLREQRWMTRQGTFLMTETPALWANTPSWNTGCIFCHNTGPRSGLVDTNAGVTVFNTELVDLGIACEACHGPALDHVRWNRNPLRRYLLRTGWVADPSVRNPARLPTALAMDVCGRCHGKWHLADHDAQLRAQDPFLPGHERLAPRYHHTFQGAPGEPGDTQRGDNGQAFPQAGYYWPDGTPQATGMEQLGIERSACRAGGMTCLTCHSMHAAPPDDQLRHPAAESDPPPTANRACTSCHAALGDAARLAAHSHHDARSAGSQCIGCHMPFQVYGLMKVVRSHRITSPAVTAEAPPNACNGCHLDQSTAWTAERLAEWYGRTGGALHGDNARVSAWVVDLAAGNAVRRAIALARVGAVASAGVPVEWAVPFVLRALEDPFHAARLLALQALRRLPGFQDAVFDYLAAPEVRRAQTRALAARWTARRAERPLAVPPAVPLGPDGWPVAAVLERLEAHPERAGVLAVSE